jgi:hypothetical protein
MPNPEKPLGSPEAIRRRHGVFGDDQLSGDIDEAEWGGENHQ